MINENLIEKRYKEMKEAGLLEDNLEEKAFGGIRIFINHQPKHYIVFMKIGEDMVYIGTESMEKSLPA
jgi:chemotaxis receptor (MCP) glutamine deamidase CheD